MSVPNGRRTCHALRCFHVGRGIGLVVFLAVFSLASVSAEMRLQRESRCVLAATRAACECSRDGSLWDSDATGWLRLPTGMVGEGHVFTSSYLVLTLNSGLVDRFSIHLLSMSYLYPFVYTLLVKHLVFFLSRARALNREFSVNPKFWFHVVLRVRVVLKRNR